MKQSIIKDKKHYMPIDDKISLIDDNIIKNEMFGVNMFSPKRLFGI